MLINNHEVETKFPKEMLEEGFTRIPANFYSNANKLGIDVYGSYIVMMLLDAEQSGESYSIQEIAEMGNISVRTAFRKLKEIVDTGLVKVINSGGRNRNKYDLSLFLAKMVEMNNNL